MMIVFCNFAVGCTPCANHLPTHDEASVKTTDETIYCNKIPDNRSPMARHLRVVRAQA